jgi:uncharacterized SAM-binding protein YcdF (DUF218 family)
MSVFLSKFLPILIFPVGLSAFLILFAILFRKHKRTLLALLITAICLLWLGGNRWVAMSLARSLEWKYLPPERVPQVDVIVVLGGGTEPAEAPRQGVELNGAGDRLLAAYRLFREGVAPVLLLSGGDIAFMDSSSASPAQDMQQVLVEWGIPADALWLDTSSQNTYENAVNCAAILREHQAASVLLVTSALHMPRAVTAFEKQGVQVIPYPVDYTVTEQNWHQLWHGDALSFAINLFPTAGNLSLTTSVIKEAFGLAYYNLLK